MMVRQPISRSAYIALGIASVLSLVALYWMLAHQRQETRRRSAGEKLARVQEQLMEVGVAAAATAAVRLRAIRQRRPN